MTGLHRTLLRRLHWFLACLLLWTTAPPPSTAFARDTTAFFADASPAHAAQSSFDAASVPAESTDDRHDAISSREAPRSPALSTTSRQIDRRYLYLELVTFLS